MGNLFYGNTATTGPLFYLNTSGNTVTSLGYNVIDVAFGDSRASNNQQSGWAAEYGDTTFSELDIIGAPFDPLTFEPQSGLNSVIEYELVGFPATDFNGTTRTVPGASGAVNSGNYIFLGYTVTAGDFTITGLSQNLINGAPQAVSITPRAGKSPGTITIYYEGSTTVPSDVGTYAVTFDVAAAPGFLAATGLVAGTLTISGPVVLTDSTWVYTNLAVAGTEHWYTFPVANGTTYYVWWEDSYQGGTPRPTADIIVGARYAGETSWIWGGTTTQADSAWNTPQTINANRDGTVQLRVHGYNNGTGTYGIVYSATNSRPVP
jgi:hypothetical protein